MSSIIKSISLDPETAVIAKRVPNFSRFVRECLLRWNAVQQEAVCPVERAFPDSLVGDHCVPNPSRVCLKHWPKGHAHLSDWREFRQMILAEQQGHDFTTSLTWPFLEDFDHEPRSWIQHRAEMVNFPLIDFDNMKISGNAKPKTQSKKVRSGFIGRMLNLLSK